MMYHIQYWYYYAIPPVFRRSKATVMFKKVSPHISCEVCVCVCVCVCVARSRLFSGSVFISSCPEIGRYQQTDRHPASKKALGCFVVLLHLVLGTCSLLIYCCFGVAREK